jgi:hypothetical protein
MLFSSKTVIYNCHTRQGHPNSTVFGEENSLFIKKNMSFSDETAIYLAEDFTHFCEKTTRPSQTR